MKVEGEVSIGNRHKSSKKRHALLTETLKEHFAELPAAS